jgi:hypothetical protein
VDFVLFSPTEHAYRLFMRVQSENFSKIVDPSDAMKHVTRSITFHLPYNQK